MIKIKSKILLIICIMLLSFKASAAEMENYGVAVLGALNKVTGKTSIIRVNVGEEGIFDKLNIEVISCQKTSPLDTPEAASFLNIKEENNNLFSGWMYASSPSLSAMESGVYDIWVDDCEKKLEKSENNL